MGRMTPVLLHRLPVHQALFTPDSRHLLFVQVVDPHHRQGPIRLVDLSDPGQVHELSLEAAEIAVWGEGADACLLLLQLEPERVGVVRWPSLEPAGHLPIEQAGMRHWGDRHLLAGPDYVAWANRNELALVRAAPPAGAPQRVQVVAEAKHTSAPGPTHAVSLATDDKGQRFLAGTPGGGMSLLFAPSGEHRHLDVSLPGGHPFGHALSPCGTLAVVCSRKLQFVQTGSSEMLGTLPSRGGKGANKWAACFLPYSTYVLGTQNGSWWAVDTEDGRVVEAPFLPSSSTGPNQHAGNGQLAVSPDRRLLALGSHQNLAVLECAALVAALSGAPTADRWVLTEEDRAHNRDWRRRHQ